MHQPFLMGCKVGLECLGVSTRKMTKFVDAVVENLKQLLISYVSQGLSLSSLGHVAENLDSQGADAVIRTLQQRYEEVAHLLWG